MDDKNKSQDLTTGQTKQQALTSHRPQTEPNSKKWRLVKIKSFFRDFYQKDFGEVEMLQASETVDLLSIFTNEEIEHGLQQYQIMGPRNDAGFLRKPAKGDLYQFLMNERGKARMESKPPEEEPAPIKRVTQDQREKISEELGFDLRNIGKTQGA